MCSNKHRCNWGSSTSTLLPDSSSASVVQESEDDSGNADALPSELGSDGDNDSSIQFDVHTPFSDSHQSDIYSDGSDEEIRYFVPSDEEEGPSATRSENVYNHMFHPDPNFLDRLDESSISSQSVEDLKQLYAHELSIPVGGRLSRFWLRWRALGANSHAVQRIRGGLTLQWDNRPPPVTTNPSVQVHSDSNKPFKDELLAEAVQAMLDKGAIKEVMDNSPGFYSRLFMVPKKGTAKWRPVIDLSALNNYLVIPHFKMETAELIRASLQPHEWVTSVDLTDAYFHIPIHPKFRHYFRFQHRNRIFEFWATPFGLATAPLEFTDQAKQLNKIAMELGFRLNQYLDDWIDRCLILLHLLIYLGFVPNFKKCELTPKQEFDFVGTHYQLHSSRVAPTTDRIMSIHSKTTRFIDSPYQTARQFMSLIGLLNSTFLQVEQMGRLHIRPLQWQLRRWWSTGVSYDKPIPVPPCLNRHLRWWSRVATLREGTDLHPPKCDVQVFTDASDTGWGAHCLGEEIQGDWSPLELNLHINVQEMKAILFALKSFTHLLKGKIVMFLCDNSTTV